MKTRSKLKALQENIQKIFKLQWRGQSGEISDQVNQQINKLAADIARKGLQSIDDKFTNFGEVAATVVREWMENEEEDTHMEELEESPAKTINDNIDNVKKIEEIYKPAIREVTKQSEEKEKMSPSAPSKEEELNMAYGIIASLKGQLTEKQDKVKELERVNQELVDDVNSLVDERDRVRESKSGLVKSLEEASTQMKRYEQINVWAEGLLKDNRTLKEQLAEANDKISTYIRFKEKAQDMDVKIRFLETKLKEAEGIAGKETRLGLEVQKLQDQLSRLQENEETLKAELKSARDHLQDTEELKEELRSLREQATHMGEILRNQRQRGEEVRGHDEYSWTFPFQGNKGEEKITITPPFTPIPGRYPAGAGYSPYKSRMEEDSRKKLQKISSKEIEKLSQYSGRNTNDMIDEYFTRLDRLIITSFDMPQYPEEVAMLKASILLTKLADPARSHIDNTLSSIQKCDHREIISELKRRFEYGRDEYYYKQKLREIPGDGKHPFVEMVSTVESLVKNMLRYTNPDVLEGTPTHKTLFETYCRGWVEEKMAKAHLTFIKMQNPVINYQTLKEAGARLDDINKTNKPARVNLVNPDSNKPVKVKAKEVTQNCNYCEKPGHQEVNCWRKHPDKAPTKSTTSTPMNSTPNLPSGANRLATQINSPCDFCGKIGHRLVDCFQLEKYSKKAKEEQIFKQSLYCSHCKTNGHSTERCRKIQRPSSEVTPDKRA